MTPCISKVNVHGFEEENKIKWNVDAIHLHMHVLFTRYATFKPLTNNGLILTYLKKCLKLLNIHMQFICLISKKSNKHFLKVAENKYIHSNF